MASVKSTEQVRIKHVVADKGTAAVNFRDFSNEQNTRLPEAKKLVKRSEAKAFEQNQKAAAAGTGVYASSPLSLTQAKSQ